MKATLMIVKTCIAVIIFTVIAIRLLVFWIGPNDDKEEMTQAVKGQTGRDVKIDDIIRSLFSLFSPIRDKTNVSSALHFTNDRVFIS